MRSPGLLLLLVAAASCYHRAPFEIDGYPSRGVVIDRHVELAIKLQNIGPGIYVDPPTVTGTALEYEGEWYNGQPVPGGVTQLFHFRPVGIGTALVRFQHTGNNPVVEDTIVVR